MTLTFVEDTHEYRLDGEVIPSVTEILKPLTETQYNAIPPDVLRIAAERGTDVHAACEAIDYELTPDIEYPDIIGYIAAYEQFLYDHAVEWYGIEEMGACTTWPIDFAGTVDRWGEVDGCFSIVDIKTTQSPSIEQKVSVCLQTFMYASIISEKHDVTFAKRYALFLKKDGDYSLLDCGEFEGKEGILLFSMADDLISLWKQKQDAQKIVRTIKERHRRKKDE